MSGGAVSIPAPFEAKPLMDGDCSHAAQVAPPGAAVDTVRRRVADRAIRRDRDNRRHVRFCDTAYEGDARENWLFYIGAAMVKQMYASGGGHGW